MKIVNKIQKKPIVAPRSTTKISTVTKSVVKPIKSVSAKASEALVIAVGNTRFWVQGGGVLAHLKDLERALLTMSESQYIHHANKMKNDFAKWTEEVLKDKKTAELLKKAKSKVDAAKAVAKSLVRFK